MKTKLLTLFLAFAAVLGMQAQSLTGKTWVATVNDKDVKDGKITMNFNQNGAFFLKVYVVNVDSDEKFGEIAVKVTVTVPGSYTRKDNLLTFNFDKDHGDADFDVDVRNSDQQTKEFFQKLMKDQMANQKTVMVREMVNEFGMEKLNIVSLTEDKLVVKDSEGEVMTFTAQQ